jgi:hypothetical protein
MVTITHKVISGAGTGMKQHLTKYPRTRTNGDLTSSTPATTFSNLHPPHPAYATKNAPSLRPAKLPKTHSTHPLHSVSRPALSFSLAVPSLNPQHHTYQLPCVDPRATLDAHTVQDPDAPINKYVCAVRLYSYTATATSRHAHLRSAGAGAHAAP